MLEDDEIIDRRRLYIEEDEIGNQRKLYTEEEENNLKSKINQILNSEVFNNKLEIYIGISHSDDKSCRGIKETLLIRLENFDGIDLKNEVEVVNTYNEILKAKILNILYEHTKEGQKFL